MFRPPGMAKSKQNSKDIRAQLRLALSVSLFPGFLVSLGFICVYLLLTMLRNFGPAEKAAVSIDTLF